MMKFRRSNIVTLSLPLLPASLAFVLIFSSCNKSDSSNPPVPSNLIDVSAQWILDNNHQVLYSPGDSQWHKKNFTPEELNLFTSLDTANLTGTVTPDSVQETPPYYNAFYPNPSTGQINIPSFFYFANPANGYMGPFVFKCVIVDSMMNPLYKKVIRSSAIPAPGPQHLSWGGISITPILPTGRFRIYFTFSSQADPHFYKSWGNIQRN